MSITNHSEFIRKYTVIAGWLDGFGPPFMEFTEASSPDEACSQARVQIATRRWNGYADALQLGQRNISIIDILEGHPWDLAV